MKIINLQSIIDRYLGNYNNKKILIVGLSKTGTTGLYYKIKNSLPSKTPVYFEKSFNSSMRRKIDNKNTYLCKLIMGSIFSSNIYDEVDSLFNKIILIIRDPRDRLISELLYFGAWKHANIEDRSKIKNIIELLKLKETNPQKVSVINIFRNVDDEFLKYTIKDWNIQSERMIKFAEEKNCFIFKYEEFVNDLCGELEKYLGFKLRGQAKVDNEHKRVIRTKNSGDWCNWFADEDIDYFKPVFSNYMKYFDYDTTDWKINKNPKIVSDYSSEYFRKVINERSKNLGKANF